MIKSIWDIISCSEAVLFVLPVVLFYQTNDYSHLTRLATLLATMFSGEAIKYYIIGDASPRPIEAYDCDMFCNNGNQGGKPGMPSTHMAVASAFSILYLPKPISTSITQPIAFYFLLLVGAMASARYYKKCHTIEQIIAGTLFGITCGLIYRALIGDIQ